MANESIKKSEDEKTYYRDLEFPDYYIANPCSEEGKQIIDAVNRFLETNSNSNLKLRINPYYQLDILTKIPEDAEKVVSQTATSKYVSIKEFSESGLLVLVNSFLHIFGLALGYHCDPSKQFYGNLFITRTSCRGFTNESMARAYKRVTEYMNKHIAELSGDIKD